MRRSIAAVLLLLPSLLVWLPGVARADTVRVLTTGAFKQVVLAAVPKFAAQSGSKVEVVNDTAGAIVRRIASGETFDVLVLTPSGLAPLAKDRVVAPDTVVPLAKVAIGVAVKAGAPKPALATVDDFKAAVLAARRVAYIDPASGGSSGIYLDGLFERLGIGDAVRAKAVLVPGGLVADRLVTGEADLAIHQVSEILPVKGVTLVAPLPDAIQNHTTYAGAVSANTPHADAARRFLDGLRDPEVIRAKGMLPP